MINLKLIVVTKFKNIKLQTNEKGIIKSEIHPGLWLDVTALLNRDLVKVLDILKQGMATSDYKNFCENISIKD